MKFTPISTALAATLLLATSPGFGGTWASEPWGRSVPRACTPEAQKCLEKLEVRLQRLGHAHDAIGIDRALLELHETDPECALLLRGAGLNGF
jgi:hypothetical protein